MNKQDSISLYGIADEFEQLDEMLEATGGEITEEWEAKQSMLLELMTKKIDGLCGYVRRLEDMMEMAEKQRKQLADFIRAKQNKKDNLDHYVRLCLQKLGKDKFQGEMYEAKPNAPGKSLQIQVGAEKNIPAEFIYTPKPVPQVMKKELKDAVAKGKVQIEGVSIVEGVPSIKYSLRTESRRKKKENSDATESNEAAGNNPAAATEAAAAEPTAAH